MAIDDGVRPAMAQAAETARRAVEKGREAAEQGYQAAQQYVSENGLNFDLRDLVRREPWLALAAAFAVGYVASQIVKRVS